MINICLDNEDTCEKFEDYENAIKYLKRKKEDSEKIIVGDFVKVIDTGKCYSCLTDEQLEDLYCALPNNSKESLKIIFDINKECLGYSKGIYERKEPFEVISIFDNGRKCLLKPTDFIQYDGFYIIGMTGVKKCEI